MRLFYDKEKTKELEKRLFEKWEKEKNVRNTSLPFHVSDLISCEMKVWCRFVGIKERITKKNIGMMVFGIIGQQIIQLLYSEKEIEYETKLENLVFGHIDVYEKFKFPIECKVTRRRMYKKQNIPNKWIQQLMAYMSLEKRNVGWFVFIDVFTTQLIVFRLEMTEQELINFNTYLISRVYDLLTAMKRKDYSKLNISPEEYDSCVFKHECPRREECYRKKKMIENGRSK